MVLEFDKKANFIYKTQKIKYRHRRPYKKAKQASNIYLFLKEPLLPVSKIFMKN